MFPFTLWSVGFTTDEKERLIGSIPFVNCVYNDISNHGYISNGNGGKNRAPNDWWYNPYIEQPADYHLTSQRLCGYMLLQEPEELNEAQEKSEGSEKLKEAV
jgi:hypothetical protein